MVPPCPPSWRHCYGRNLLRQVRDRLHDVTVTNRIWHHVHPSSCCIQLLTASAVPEYTRSPSHRCALRLGGVHTQMSPPILYGLIARRPASVAVVDHGFEARPKNAGRARNEFDGNWSSTWLCCSWSLALPRCGCGCTSWSPEFLKQLHSEDYEPFSNHSSSPGEAIAQHPYSHRGALLFRKRHEKSDSYQTKRAVFPYSEIRKHLRPESQSPVSPRMGQYHEDACRIGVGAWITGTGIGAIPGHRADEPKCDP